MAKFVATFSKYPVSNYISTDLETLNMAEMLSLVWFDTNANLGFPCHTSEHVPPQIPSP